MRPFWKSNDVQYRDRVGEVGIAIARRHQVKRVSGAQFVSARCAKESVVTEILESLGRGGGGEAEGKKKRSQR